MSDFYESQVVNDGKPCDSLRPWQVTLVYAEREATLLTHHLR
jgi:hypothetical protein